MCLKSLRVTMSTTVWPRSGGACFKHVKVNRSQTDNASQRVVSRPCSVTTRTHTRTHVRTHAREVLFTEHFRSSFSSPLPNYDAKSGSCTSLLHLLQCAASSSNPHLFTSRLMSTHPILGVPFARVRLTSITIACFTYVLHPSTQYVHTSAI